MCIAALHNNCFPDGQKSGITPTADAHDGLLPVPSQQLFPSGGLITFTLQGPRLSPAAPFFVLLPCSLEIFSPRYSRTRERRRFEGDRRRRMKKRVIARSASTAPLTLNRHLLTPAPSPSQGCKPRLCLGAGLLGRSCAGPSAPRSGKCLRNRMKTGRGGRYAVP